MVIIIFTFCKKLLYYLDKVFYVTQNGIRALVHTLCHTQGTEDFIFKLSKTNYKNTEIFPIKHSTVFIMKSYKIIMFSIMLQNVINTLQEIIKNYKVIIIPM
jgi:hypothetical protein